jgi:ribosomal protein L7/L12
MSTIEQQDIAALRQRISRLEAQIEFLYSHLGVTFVENNSPLDNPKVIDALRANNVIEAIKQYREATGMGLAEAKIAVEEIRARLGL